MRVDFTKKNNFGTERKAEPVKNIEETPAPPVHTNKVEMSPIVETAPAKEKTEAHKHEKVREKFHRPEKGHRRDKKAEHQHEASKIAVPEIFVRDPKRPNFLQALKENGFLYLISWFVIVFVMTLFPSLMLIASLPGMGAYALATLCLSAVFFYYGSRFYGYGTPSLVGVALVVVLFGMFWVIHPLLEVLTIVITAVVYLIGAYSWKIKAKLTSGNKGTKLETSKE